MSKQEIFAKVFAEFDGKVTRDELKVYQDKFYVFDVNGDHHIDLFELKLAQEKLGTPKTHQEVVNMMEQLASDPKKGITFRDFVVVQLLGKGIKIETKLKVSDLIAKFAKEIEDFSVTGIKNHIEEKLRLEKIKKEREEILKSGSSEEKKRVLAEIKKENEELDKLKELQKKEKEEEEKRKRKEQEELQRMKEEEEKKKKEEQSKRDEFKKRFASFEKK